MHDAGHNPLLLQTRPRSLLALPILELDTFQTPSFSWRCDLGRGLYFVNVSHSLPRFLPFHLVLLDMPLLIRHVADLILCVLTTFRDCNEREDGIAARIAMLQNLVQFPPHFLAICSSRPAYQASTLRLAPEKGLWYLLRLFCIKCLLGPRYYPQGLQNNERTLNSRAGQVGATTSVRFTPSIVSPSHDRLFA